MTETEPHCYYNLGCRKKIKESVMTRCFVTSNKKKNRVLLQKQRDGLDDLLILTPNLCTDTHNSGIVAYVSKKMRIGPKKTLWWELWLTTCLLSTILISAGEFFILAYPLFSFVSLEICNLVLDNFAHFSASYKRNVQGTSRMYQDVPKV